jgi:hypothetical protein
VDDFLHVSLISLRIVELTIRIRETLLDGEICPRQNRLMEYVCLLSRILGLRMVMSILFSPTSVHMGHLNLLRYPEQGIYDVSEGKLSVCVISISMVILALWLSVVQRIEKEEKEVVKE